MAHCLKSTDGAGAPSRLAEPAAVRMSLPRKVAPETLDGLAENDPAAMRSRRDLQRIHRVMGTRSIVARALQRFATRFPAAKPLRMLELGAGDGSLMLGVARSSGLNLPGVELTLLDRQHLVGKATMADYADAGWRAGTDVRDVFDWAAAPGRWDIIVSNLFLHHFEGGQLHALLTAIESSTDGFFACEPRRGRLALAASHLVGAIGANAVTREDAVLSVHAGFRETEISQSWPRASRSGPDWALDEYPAGLFSHCFCAMRRDSHQAQPKGLQ